MRRSFKNFLFCFWCITIIIKMRVKCNMLLLMCYYVGIAQYAVTIIIAFDINNIIYVKRICHYYCKIFATNNKIKTLLRTASNLI